MDTDNLTALECPICVDFRGGGENRSTRRKTLEAQRHQLRELSHDKHLPDLA